MRRTQECYVLVFAALEHFSATVVSIRKTCTYTWSHPFYIDTGTRLCVTIYWIKSNIQLSKTVCAHPRNLQLHIHTHSHAHTQWMWAEVPTQVFMLHAFRGQLKVNSRANTDVKGTNRQTYSHLIWRHNSDLCPIKHENACPRAYHSFRISLTQWLLYEAKGTHKWMKLFCQSMYQYMCDANIFRLCLLWCLLFLFVLAPSMCSSVALWKHTLPLAGENSFVWIINNSTYILIFSSLVHIKCHSGKLSVTLMKMLCTDYRVPLFDGILTRNESSRERTEILNHQGKANSINSFLLDSS